jgi:hypothetical protein
MRRQDTGDPELGALTLLIQLFGREPIEALSAAGFNDNESIAQAGPERLSEAASVPLTLARRIVAVAVEAREVAAAEAREVADAGAAAVEIDAPARTTTADTDDETPSVGDEGQRGETRHVRRPLRRPHSRLVDPAAPATPRPADEEGGRGSSGADEARRRTPPLDPDPFIDEAGLVSWMGFAGQHGAAVPFSVADTILDTAPRPAASAAKPPARAAEPAPAPAAAAAPARAPSSEPAGPRKAAPVLPPAAQPAEPKAPAAPRQPAAAPGHTPPSSRQPSAVPRQPPTLPRQTPAVPRQAPARPTPAADGSFWSFGALPMPQTRPDPAADPKHQEKERPTRPRPAGPRRRSHDGH